MRIAIIGASGLVGYNCQRYFKEQGVEVLGTHLTYAAENTSFFDTVDLANPANCDLIGFKPTHILHAAALTHVDYCEEHEDESYLMTVGSTQNIIDLGKQTNASIIYISTDYIFDGKSGPYAETDLSNPLNIYGSHKLEAEELVKQSGLNYLILRITNVYGDEPRGKNFVTRLIELARGGEQVTYKVPIDQYATPVNALDVAKALYNLCLASSWGIYHFASTDYMNRAQMAHKILDGIEDHKLTIEVVETITIKQIASRPLSGGLKCHKFNCQFPNFAASNLDTYLSQIKGKYQG